MKGKIVVVIRRFGVVAALVGMTVLTATCKLDDLVVPPTAGVLAVALPQVVDSAAVGSVATRTVTFTISSGRAGSNLEWTGTRAHNSDWLTFNPAGGTTPTTVSVIANPAGLAKDTYRDTLVLSATGAGTLRVPIEFRVYPCATEAIVAGTPKTGSLSESDCGAPARSGRFAKIYSFSGHAGDSLTARLSSGAFDAYVTVDTLPGSLTLRENDTCDAGATDACVRYLLLRETRTYYVEMTTGPEGQTGAFTALVHNPRPPELPDSLRQLQADSTLAIPVGGAADLGAVVLSAVVEDPDEDSLRIETEVQPLGTDFTGVPTAISSIVGNDRRAFVRIPGLTDNGSYHWRSRVVDQTGRRSAWTSFGENGETAADFAVAIQEPPTLPTALAQFRADGVTPIPLGGPGNDPTTVFKAMVSDPDPGSSLRLDVEVLPVGTTFTGAPTASSTSVGIGGVAQVAVAGLLDNVTYHWRARTVDQTGRASAWIAFGSNPETDADFRVALPPAQLAFTVQPTTVTAGAAIAPAVTVTARDGAGATVASYTGNVTITLATNPGGGTLGGTATVAAVGGVATFSTLTVNRSGVGYALQATSGALGVTSGAFNVTPGTATALMFTVQPSAVLASAVITPAVQITAQDALGNTVVGFTGSVTLALGSNAAGGVLSGGSATAAVSGVASFPALSLDRAGTGYTLVASATGLGNTTSQPFNVSAGGASLSRSLVSVSAPTVASGSTVTLKLQAKDGAGNNLTGGGLTVSFTPTGGTSTGTMGAVVDHADGTYTATFTGVGAGTATTIGASIGGNAVTSTLPTLTVTPGPVSVTQSLVTVSVGTVLSAGTSTLTLRARDAVGNNLTSGGLTVVFNRSGGTSTGTISTTTDVGNGTYTAIFTGVAAGTATTIGATVGGTAVASALPTITVSSGTASLGMSVVTTSLSTIASGSAATLTLQSKDAAGNNLAAGGLTVAFTRTGGTSTGTISTTTDNGNGTYTTTFTGLVAGTATTIGATIGGAPVTSALPTITVTVGPASVATSLVTRSSATVVSGSGVTLTLQAKDAAGNTITTGGLVVLFNRSGGASTGTIGSTTDVGNGTYTATFTGVLAGTATTIGATIGGVAVTSTLPTLQVLPGAITTAQSLVTVSAPTVASGGTVTLTLQAKDAAGNNLTTSGSTVVFALSGTGTSTGTISATTPGAAGSGTYTATFTGGAAGTARTIGASITGLGAVTSTATVTVTAGGASLVTSVVTRSSETLASGSVATLTLQTKDAAGNNLPAGGLTVVFTRAGGTSTGVISATTDQGDGTYTATFTGAVSGTATTIGATIGGSAVTSTLPTITVTPGPASVATSVVTRSAATVASGSAVTLTLQAKDAAGNTITSGGLAVVFNRSGGTSTGTIGTTTDVGNGTYTASFTGVAAGTATTIGATIGGTAVTSTLPTVQVTPGTISTVTSLVTVSSPTVASGSVVTLTLQAKDAAGNNLTTGGSTVAFTQSGGTSTGTISGTTNVGNGTYTATFTGTGVGTARTIGATIGAVAVTSTPLPTVTVSSGAASTVTSLVTVSAGSVASGNAVTLTLQAKDAAGNNITTGGLTVVFSRTGGTSTGTISGSTNVGNGTYTASFSGVAAGTATTITATINGTAVTSTLPTVTVTPGAASTAASVVTTSNPSIASGATATLTLQARDAAGNNLAGGGLAVLLTSTGGTSTGTIGTTTDHNDGTYTAVFTGEIAGTATTIGATIGGSAVTSALPTITVTPGTASTATSVVTTSSGSIASGTAATLTLQAKDAQGNNLTTGGLTVLFSTSGGSSTGTIGATTNNGNGTYTATMTGLLAGTATTIRATIGGTLVTTTPPSVTVTPGVAATLTKSGGDNLSGPVNSTLGTAHEALIRDAAGNPVPGFTVFWAAASGGGVVNPDNSPTDAAGHATTTRTLGPGAGPQSTTATATIGGSPVSVTYAITATAGGASQMSSSSGDGQSGVIGTALANPLSVRVADGSNNPVQNVTVSWQVRTSGGGTVSAPTSVTNSSGIASINWTLGTVAALHVVQATAVGAPVNFTATATPGPASTSTSLLTSSTSTLASGTAATLTLQARDASGNNETTGGLAVVFSRNGGTSTGSISGTTDLGNGTYTATFTGLLAGTATAINATIAGVAVTSAHPTIVVTPGAVSLSTSTVTTSNVTLASGTAATLTLTSRDAAGNSLTDGGLAVAFTATGGTSTGTLSGVTDHDNGTYSANFMGVTAGTATTISATIGGSVVASALPTITVTSGTVSTTTSTVSVGSGTVASGSGTTLTLQARDAAGNAFGSALTVTFTASGGTSTGTIGAITNNGNGNYTATFTGLAAGSATTIGATVGGSAVASALPTITVTPGPASTVTSGVSVGSGTVASGAGTTLTLEARDAAGNNITTGGLTVVFTKNAGTSDGTISATTSVGNGTYTATFTGTTSGTARTIGATIGGTAVTSALPTITVTPGSASAATSLVSVGSGSVASGTSTTITLQARDAAGNTLTTGGLAVAFGTSGGTSTGAIAATADHADGTYTAAFTGNQVGSATTITATIGGTAVTSTLPTIAVTPGAVSTTTSTVAVGVGTVASGSGTTLTLQARDAAGNAYTAGLTVVFTQTGGGSNGTISATASNANGTYTATFTGTAAGTATTIGATINGSPVMSALPTITVTPGPPSAATSSVSAGVTTLASGTSTTLTLQARDAASNELDGGGLTVVFTATGGTSTGTVSATTDHADGTYTATFTGVGAGTARTIGATIGGVAVTSTLPTITVTPGPASTSVSTVTVGSGTVSSGGTTTVTLHARDAAANAHAAGGLVVAFTRSGGTSTGTFGSTTDNGDGTYTATFTGAASGTATAIGATIGGAPVTSALPTITVTPGTASTATSTVTVGSGTVVSGASTTLTLQARDGGGNALGTGGLTVVFTRTGGTSSGTISPTTDNGDGTYSATFTASAAGTATTIGATIGGTPVSSTLPTITVTAGSASTVTSVVTVGSLTVVSGSSTTLTLQARDAAGNNLAAGGLTVVFTATGGTATGTIGATTDVGNGTYTATFTGVAAGTAKAIGATIGGSAVTSTLPSITVTAGGASTATSVVSVGVGTVASGSGTTLTLQARDAAGNALAAGGLTVVFTRSGGTSTGAISATADQNNGTYTATFTGVVAGTATTIGATIGGSAVTSVLPTITVNPGNVSTATSVVSVGNGTVASGAGTSLTLQARDAAGNALTTGGSTVAFTRTGGTSTGTISSTTDNGNGTYTATFTGAAAGTGTTIGATIDGTAVASALPTITVTPGAASTVASVVTVESGTVESGGTTTLTLTSKDAAGNNLTVGGLTVTFTATGGTSTGTIGATGDNGNGTYSAIFTGAATGTATTIGATIGGVAVTSTLPTIIVTAGSPSTVTSVVTVGSPTVASGSTTTLTLQARDGAGNNLTAGGLTVLFTRSGGTSTGTIGGTTDNNNGTYSASFTGVAAGSATTIGATIGGVAVTSTLPTISVVAGPASAATTTATVPAGTAGSLTTIAVQTRDAAGNNRTTTGGTLVVTVGGANTGTSVTEVDNGNGTYSATYTPNVAGTDNFTITLGGVTIGGGPYTSAVSAGAPSAAQATADVPDGNSGSPTTVTITVRDAHNNIRVASNDASQLSVTITGSNPGTPTVTSAGSGVYTATYTPVLIGADNVVIRLNGVLIGGNPYVSVVSPGAPSPSASRASTPDGTAGSPTTLTITVKDAAGNIRTASNDVSLLGATITGANPQTLSVTPAGSGAYTATYTPVASGTDNFNITLNGTTIGGGPYTSDVSPGAPSAVTTTASISVGIAGLTRTITITVKDADGNIRSGTDDHGLLSVTIFNNNFGILPVISAGAGIYTATYLPLLSGQDLVNITVGGVLTAQSPLDGTLGAGAAVSFQLAGIPSPATLGHAYTLTVIARDANGNAAENYAGTVSFSVAPGTATLPGSYTFTPRDEDGNGDQGVHEFPGGVAFLDFGDQTLTVTDAVNGITATRLTTVPNPDDEAAPPVNP